MGDDGTTTARRIAIALVSATNPPRDAALSGSMVAPSGVSMIPSSLNAYRVGSSDTGTHRMKGIKEWSCGRSHLHARYPVNGIAIAVQTMAAAAVKYVLPIRSSIRLVRARDATASLSFNTVTPFRDI